MNGAIFSKYEQSPINLDLTLSRLIGLITRNKELSSAKLDTYNACRLIVQCE